MKRLSLAKIKIYEPLLWVYFLWYYLPIARAFFKSDTYNKLFFGALVMGCLLCGAQILARSTKVKLRFSVLVPVLAYFAVFTFFTLLNVGTADRHIRVSFSFWGTLIIFYITSNYPDLQSRLCKLMFLMFFATTITSILGVIANPQAARLITYAGNDEQEDIVIRLLNIGGLAFFQGLVITVPIWVSFISQQKYRIFSIVMLVLIFIGLLHASFTISIILFFVAILLGYMANKASATKIFIFACVLLLVFVVPWEQVLVYFAERTNNARIHDRLLSLADTWASGAAEGDLKARVELYGASLDTFLRHPFGVGPEYTYVDFQNGIGYHSQILDDMARYGIFALAFYVAFFAGYFKVVKAQWRKINMEQVAWPVLVLYICFLILNPGFTSAHESVMMLFMIPTIPIVLQKRNNRKLNAENQV